MQFFVVWKRSLLPKVPLWHFQLDLAKSNKSLDPIKNMLYFWEFNVSLLWHLTKLRPEQKSASPLWRLKIISILHIICTDEAPSCFFVWNIHDYGYNDDTLIYISHLHKNNPNIPILPLYIVYFENISAFCKYHHFPILATALVELLRAQYLLYLEATQFFISSASSFTGRLFWKRSFMKLFIFTRVGQSKYILQ